jgi:hypothetical protein
MVDKIVFMHEGRLGRVGTRDELLPALLGQAVTPMHRDAQVPGERRHQVESHHRADGAPRNVPHSNPVRPVHAARQ